MSSLESATVAVALFALCFGVVAFVQQDSSVFNGADVCLTQSQISYALNHGDLLTQLMATVNSQHLPDRSTSGGGFPVKFAIDFSGSSSSYHVDLVPSANPVRIMNGNQIILTNDFIVTADLRANVMLWIFGIRDTLCGTGDSNPLSFRAHTVTTISGSVNPNSRGLQVTQNTVLTISDLSYRFCADGNLIGHWLIILFDVRDMVNSFIQSAIQTLVNSQSSTLTVPQTFQPNPLFPMQVTYWVSGLDTLQDSYIHMAGQLSISVNVTTGNTSRLISFIPEPDDAVTAPPNSCTLLDPRPGDTLLSRVALSSTLMDAIMFSADALGDIDHNQTMVFLGSSMVSAYAWSGLHFGVSPSAQTTLSSQQTPGDQPPYVPGLCSYHIDGGNASVVCNTPSTPAFGQFMFLGNFSQIDALGAATYTEDAAPGLAFHFTKVDTSRMNPTLVTPNVPGFNFLVQSFLQEAVTRGLKAINGLFADFPIYLPPMFQPWVVSPVLQVYWQIRSHGFFLLGTWCACGAPRGLTPECKFPCSSSLSDTKRSHMSVHVAAPNVWLTTYPNSACGSDPIHPSRFSHSLTLDDGCYIDPVSGYGYRGTINADNKTNATVLECYDPQCQQCDELLSGATFNTCIHVDADDTFATLSHSLTCASLDPTFTLSHSPNVLELFFGAPSNPCNASLPFPTLSDYVVLVLPEEGTLRGEGGVFSTFKCNSSNSDHSLKTLNCTVAIQCATSNLTNCTFAYSGLIPDRCVPIGSNSYARISSGYVPPPNHTWSIVIGIIIGVIAIGAVALLAYLIIRYLKAAHAKRLAERAYPSTPSDPPSSPSPDSASINNTGDSETVGSEQRGEWREWLATLTSLLPTRASIQETMASLKSSLSEITLRRAEDSLDFIPSLLLTALFIVFVSYWAYSDLFFALGIDAARQLNAGNVVGLNLASVLSPLHVAAEKGFIFVGVALIAICFSALFKFPSSTWNARSTAFRTVLLFLFVWAVFFVTVAPLLLADLSNAITLPVGNNDDLKSHADLMARIVSGLNLGYVGLLANLLGRLQIFIFKAISSGLWIAVASYLARYPKLPGGYFLLLGEGEKFEAQTGLWFSGWSSRFVEVGLIRVAIGLAFLIEVLGTLAPLIVGYQTINGSVTWCIVWLGSYIVDGALAFELIRILIGAYSGWESRSIRVSAVRVLALQCVTLVAFFWALLSVESALAVFSAQYPMLLFCLTGTAAFGFVWSLLQLFVHQDHLPKGSIPLTAPETQGYTIIDETNDGKKENFTDGTDPEDPDHFELKSRVEVWLRSTKWPIAAAVVLLLPLFVSHASDVFLLSARDRVSRTLLVSFNISINWPNSTTELDPPANAYVRFDGFGFIFFVFAVVQLFASGFVSIKGSCCGPKAGRFAAILVLLGLTTVCLFATALFPTFPPYVSYINLDGICPNCGDQLTLLIHSVLGNAFGELFGAFAASRVLFLVIAVAPVLVRGADSLERKLRIRAHSLFLVASIIGPFVLSFPTALFIQTIPQDAPAKLALVGLVFLPGIISIVKLIAVQLEIDSLNNKMLYIWWAAYYGMLFSVIGANIAAHPDYFHDIVRHYILDPFFWIEIFEELLFAYCVITASLLLNFNHDGGMVRIRRKRAEGETSSELPNVATSISTAPEPHGVESSLLLDS